MLQSLNRFVNLGQQFFALSEQFDLLGQQFVQAFEFVVYAALKPTLEK
jgi:hypothetical protein